MTIHKQTEEIERQILNPKACPSSKSQDTAILISSAALKKHPSFWNWPVLYTDSGAGYPQLYATANIQIDGKNLKDQHIRIYYYNEKKEFRLQCELIKRNGKKGDIITISHSQKKPLEFDIKLLRQNTTKHKVLLPLLANKVSTQKFFAYY